MAGDAVQRSALAQMVREYMSPPVTETFNTPGAGTWECPPNVETVLARVWGAGCGSTAGGVTLGTAGNGGGGFSEKTITVVPGTTYNYSVGAAGVKGANQGATTIGGDSWFVDATTCMAKGGDKGADAVTPGVGGLASAGFGDTKRNGGTGGATGGSDAGSGGGSSAGPAAAGGTGSASTTGGGAGGVAPTGGGTGGAGGAASGNGANGVAPGGGAGGAGKQPGIGADGAAGRVQLIYQPA